MNRFNLTFWGEILPGKDPEQVKTGLAQLLGIEDSTELRKCFSGSRVILRRNLDRKAAAEFYSKLHRLGAVTKLDKVSDRDLAQAESEQAPSPTPPPPPMPSKSAAITTRPASRAAKKSTPAAAPDKHRSQSNDFLRRELGLVQRSSSHGPGPADKDSTVTPVVATSPAAGPQKVAQSPAEIARKKQLADDEVARLKAREHALQHALRARDNNGAPLQEKEVALAQALESRSAGQDSPTQPPGRPAGADDTEQEATEAEAQRQAEQERQAAANNAQREMEAAEEAARLEADEALRQANEAEARRKTERERKDAADAALREAQAAAAQRKAEEAQAKRKLEEAESRRKAEEAEARRKAEEAEARRKAEEAEARRKAEEAAKRKAERERKAAAAKQRKAEQEETRRQKAEEAKLRKAARAKAKRQKAREAARVKAERDRQQAEEAARRKAELEEARRLRAEEEARQTTELEEQRRKEDELKARLAAEHEETVRLQRAQEAEQKRLAAEEEAARARLREQEKQQAAERAAAQKAEAAERKRQQAEEAARRRAEEQRLRDEEQARKKAAEAEQTAQRLAMEEQTIQRAAAELAQKPSLQGATAAPAASAPGPALDGRRKRQPGEANLFSLRPFRNTPQVQARVEQSLRRVRLGLWVAVVALVGLVLIGVALLTRPAVPLPAGPDGIAIDGQGKPLLLAGEQLFLLDRSGSALKKLRLAELGLASLQPPLAFDSAGNLFGLGVLADDATGSSTPELLRCQLAQSACQVFAPALAPFTVSSFTIHPLDDTVFVADAASGQLLKVNASGAIVARAVANLPPQPVLLPDSGLLLVNSAQGPAISVFRYENSAFGQQLDEILLLVPVNRGPDQLRVRDFVLSADSWWITLADSAVGRTGLYRFDSRWNFIEQVELAAGTEPAQLASWSGKTLVLDPRHLAIQRFNAAGTPEAALVATQLEEMIAAAGSSAGITALLWRGALALCILALVIGCCVAWLSRVRNLVYKTCRARGAEPIDDLAASIRWVDPDAAHARTLRHVAIAYGLLSLALVLVAAGLSVSPIALSALLLALAGPAAALILLYRSPAGHIGLIQDQLLLVDHTGMYHLGAGGRIHYRGHFLIIDDVAVFTGARLLPAFCPSQIEEQVMPLVRGGIKVDRGIVLVKLLQSRHPLAIGAVVTAATVVAAITGLFFQGIF